MIGPGVIDFRPDIAQYIDAWRIAFGNLITANNGEIPLFFAHGLPMVFKFLFFGLLGVLLGFPFFFNGFLSFSFGGFLFLCFLSISGFLFDSLMNPFQTLMLVYLEFFPFGAGDLLQTGLAEGLQVVISGRLGGISGEPKRCGVV